MSDCVHCGTSFPATNPLEKFCCRGCEFVYDLIHDEGFERFYDLRNDQAGRPVRSLPFESHDFGWLRETVRKNEESFEVGRRAGAEFSLEGLTCMGCVWLVEKLFLRTEGALEASAHPATGLLRLKWVAGKTDIEGFAREAASFGYRLSPRKVGAGSGEVSEIAGKLGVCGAFAMNAMVFTLPRYLGMPDDFAFAGIFQLVAFASASLAMLTGGSYFIVRAWKSVRIGVAHIDLPIALGIVFSFVGSIIGWALGTEGLLYFDFVAIFIFLMLGGRYLQLAAVSRNRNQLHRQRPVPDFLCVADQGDAIPLSEIADGMRLELNSGQAIPVLGTLESETAEFSLEWINGEAEPVIFVAGRRIPAGAIFLGREKCVFRAGEKWEESLLASLTTSERTVAKVPALERLLRGYLLAVLVIGFGAFAFWYSRADFATALQVMISIFVVSCPCALGVALPLADELSGLSMERAGVFIRESTLWSRLCRVRTIFFDKTGTLTMERPALVNPGAVSELGQAGRRALAILTEGSLHPVSRSLLESLGRGGQLMLREEGHMEVFDFPGQGRTFEDEGGSWSLGRPGWRSGEMVEEMNHDAELCHSGRVVTTFRFEESLRPDAVGALKKLWSYGYRLVIVSGDRKGKVLAAASLLGIAIEDAHFALLPDEKETIVRRLDKHDSLYLGDGANDSLAFNAAWTTGTPVVDRSLLEAKADFYFMGQGLRFLPTMLSLARLRRRTVRTAFGFALIYNMVAITTAVMGHMSPLIAAIIMPLSSVITLGIVAQGLRKSDR